jgi:hypothetical protein
MTVTKEQLLNRAIEVIDKANNEGITLRAIGGAAIALIAKKDQSYIHEYTRI